MLDNISKLLTGDMLRALCDMGHGETIVIADANFPADSLSDKVQRCPGMNVSDVLSAIIDLFPIDVAYTENPAIVMELTEGDKAKRMPTPEAWGDYERIFHKRYPELKLGRVERYDFYELSKKAAVVFVTGEDRLYGNILLTKGCVI
ncbi:MAG: RbsD/FucU domain-containing protein [Clostridia bacterium]|nr:RbsD/FucU domain-containing protein [Clostridia bacterium]